MSLGQILDKQLIDNLSIYIASRQWKSAKELSMGISKFELDKETEGFVSSGWPIGKVESQDHFDLCCKKAISMGKFYNIATGLMKSAGSQAYVYGKGWCVARNSPQHIALEKILEQIPKENTLEISIKEGWAIVKGKSGIPSGTNFIWNCDKEKVVGLLIKGQPSTLSISSIETLKEENIKYEKASIDDIKKAKLE